MAAPRAGEARGLDQPCLSSPPGSVLGLFPRSLLIPGVFLHNSPFSDTSWLPAFQLNSDALWGQSRPQAKRAIHETTPTADTTCTSQVVTWLLTHGSEKSDNLPDWLIRPRENSSPAVTSYIKAATQEHSKEEMLRARFVGGGVEVWPQACPPTQEIQQILLRVLMSSIHDPTASPKGHPGGLKLPHPGSPTLQHLGAAPVSPH